MEAVEAGRANFVDALPLKSRSCRLRSDAFLFLRGREAAGKGGGERLRKGERWRG